MKCRRCGAENASDMIDCGNCGHPLSAEPPKTSERLASSDSIERILLRQAVEIEEAIRGAKGLKGFLTRRFGLPSTIVFKSEIETVSQHVDKNGKATVSKGEMPDAQMIFEGSHSSLCQMLATFPSEGKFPPVESPIKVTASAGSVGEVVFEIGTGGEVDTRYLKTLPWNLGH